MIDFSLPELIVVLIAIAFWTWVTLFVARLWKKGRQA